MNEFEEKGLEKNNTPNARFDVQFAQADRPDNVLDYVKKHLDREIALYKNYLPTGFEKLDQDSGGLKIGLYTVAAIPSLGKTTLCLQIADQLAKAGHDVIYFSLEQSRLELVTKSLSRITKIQELAGENHGALTSTQIRNGQRIPSNQVEKQIELERLSAESEYDSVGMAITEYIETVSNRLSIVEGNFELTVDAITAYIEHYIIKTGRKPVVIIDYLQILQPTVVRGRVQTVRESVDTSVTDLKRLSRKLNIPIIAISSVNRANYQTPISFESLKESGGIEYGCDVVWGMQLHCLSDELFTKEGKVVDKRKAVEEAKKANPRLIDLICLKNRYGEVGLKWSFRYYPAYDLFVEE